MKLITDKHRHDLEVKGYTVVENAVFRHEVYKKEVTQWAEESFGKGHAPFTINSLVRGYQAGHLEPLWKIRLDVREHFAQLWGDDRLLTSIDTLALGQPPEYGEEEFDKPPTHWFHTDQSAARIGLHAYQGAVYLETADEDDWTFEVLEGSHRFVEPYFEAHTEKKLKSLFRSLTRFQDDDVEWFLNKGCDRKRVPAKAGSLVLWDSRLVHANARPVKGRRHPDRWRVATFVCMAPASWTTDSDLDLKRSAYNDMMMTTHWPCDDVAILGTCVPSYAPKSSLPPLTSLPPAARSKEAKRLAGIEPYPPRQKGSSFEDLPRPEWDFKLRPDMAEKIAGTRQLRMKRLAYFLVSALILVLAISLWVWL